MIRKIGLIILVIVILFILVAIVIRDDEPQTTTTSRKLSLSASLVTELTSIIQMNGYNCPLVKQAYKRGNDAFGDVIKVYCGPKAQDGVYKNAVFRITFTPLYDKSNLIKDLLVEPRTSKMSDW